MRLQFIATTCITISPGSARRSKPGRNTEQFKRRAVNGFEIGTAVLVLELDCTQVPLDFRYVRQLVCFTKPSTTICADEEPPSLPPDSSSDSVD